MAGDIKLKYPAASSTLTTTNLQTLASDQSWLAGWVGGAVNNTSNNYIDYMYGGTFTTSNTNRQAGSIYIYVVAALADTPVWPATATGTLGTEGTLSFTDTEERDTLCKLLHSITVDNTASAIYTFPPTGIRQLFGGVVPTHHCLFVTQNVTTTTTAGFSAAAIYSTPVTYQYT
jgi:hypothetical protein